MTSKSTLHHVLVICSMLMVISGCQGPGVDKQRIENYQGAHQEFRLDRNDGITYTGIHWGRSDKITLEGASLLKNIGPVYIGNPETGEVQPLFLNGQLVDGAGLTLSPDGNLATFLNRDSQQINIVRLSSPPTLESSLPYKGFAAWSPDGQRLAVIDVISHTARIHLVDLQKQQTILVGEISGPLLLTFGDIAWSPTDEQIAFSIAWPSNFKDSMQYDIYALALRSGQVRRVTNSSDISEVSPSWSSDGRSLIFASTPVTAPTSGRLAIADFVTSCITYASKPVGISQVAWSPDGDQIAVVSSLGDSYIIDMASLRNEFVATKNDCFSFK